MPITPAGSSPVYREYEPGDYGRTLVLAEDIDAERIEAPLKDGVLTARLPKGGAARPQGTRIQAKGG